MNTYLLDVNVLIALAWPNHVHHTIARHWFQRRAKQAWATCPITQCGFVKISSNPSIIRDAVNPADALALLKQMTGHPGHRFWMDEITLGSPDFAFPGLLAGHRQITDAYLLSLAIRKKGILATLDQGLKSMDSGRKHVEVISTGGLM